MKIALRIPMLNPFDDDKVMKTKDTENGPERDLLLVDVLFGSIRFESELLSSSRENTGITENRLKRWDILKKIKTLRKEKTEVVKFDSDESKTLVDFIKSNVQMDLDIVGQSIDIINDECDRHEAFLKTIKTETKLKAI